ncbi:hypothetical protein PENTCL1PPCAC_29837, partial [Pristionchus entomophagus]
GTEMDLHSMTAMRLSSWCTLSLALSIFTYVFWRHSEYARNISVYGSDMLLSVQLETFQTGGIGNNVFELMSSIGIAKTTGRTLVLPSDLYKQFSIRHHEFINLLDGVYPQWEGTNMNGKYIDKRLSDCCRYDRGIIDDIRKSTASVTNVDLRYLQSYRYFMDLPREEIFSRLELSSHIKVVVDRDISNKNVFSHHDHILCVHSRRGDFLSTGAIQSPSNASYLLNATDFVYKTQNVNSTLVVLIGDDLKWQNEIAITLRSQRKNALVLPRLKGLSTPVADWQISRMYCDTVLLTASASTFGWWIGYLSKGQKVYYNPEPSTHPQYNKEFDSTEFFPTSWIPLYSSELLNNEESHNPESSIIFTTKKITNHKSSEQINNNDLNKNEIGQTLYSPSSVLPLNSSELPEKI